MDVPRRLRTLHLFAGAGGGILADVLLGHVPICAVELDAYCRRVLLARQLDGALPRFPIWDDVRTFDGLPWRGAVDIISGGFPCQDISLAGRGAGLGGARSGLWSEFARIIGEVRPSYVLVENSPALTTRGLGAVLGDMAAMGFDARWGVLGAVHAGAPHRRLRMWIVADANSERESQPSGSFGEERRRVGDCGQAVDGADAHGAELWQQPRRTGWQSGAEAPIAGGADEDVGDASCTRLTHAGGSEEDGRLAGFGTADGAGWWDAEPDVGRLVDGLAHRVDRGRAIGNGQVPAVAALAWEMLK